MQAHPKMFACNYGSITGRLLLYMLILSDVGDKCCVEARTLSIGFLPTFSNATNKQFSKYHVGAVVCAINDINRNPDLLQGHTLTYIYNDTKAHLLTTIRGMTSQHDDGVLAFIGPEDSCETEATVAAAWNVPMITYVSRKSPVLTQYN